MDAQITTNEEAPKEIRVWFSPELWLQRRTWILDCLREEQATSVLDLGCGEGSLLSVLLEPTSIHPGDTGLPRKPTMDIPLQRLAGIDIDTDCVKSAAAVIVPGQFDQWLPPRPRWINFHVQVWQGGLQVLGQDHVDGMHFGYSTWDVIVSTEVVEHLPEDVLADFIPMTLGVYRPRLLLLTTPNYNFNQLFSPPGTRNLATGYPDPTGATDRIFRHDDHKREWTEEEWKVWCEDAAFQWGYSVRVGGLGVASEKDPWGRHEQAGRASLTAVFRRSDIDSSDSKLKQAAALHEARLRSTLADNVTKHRLVSQERYAASPNAGKPATSEEILQLVKEMFLHDAEVKLNEGSIPLETIWLRDEITSACGGHMSALVNAISSSEAKEQGWELIREPRDGQRWREEWWTWTIVWHLYPKPSTPRPAPATIVDSSEDHGISSWGHWPTASSASWPEESEATPSGWGSDSGTDWNSVEAWGQANASWW